MIISTTLTLHRRCTGMLALLAVVLLVDNRAIASCGDYLMPLHQTEVVEVGDYQNSASDPLLRSGNRNPFGIAFLPHQKQPCHGPGCNQSSGTFTLTILPPDQGPQTFAKTPSGESGTLGDGKKPSISQWPSSERAVSSYVLDILRPPRAC